MHELFKYGIILLLLILALAGYLLRALLLMARLPMVWFRRHSMRKPCSLS